MYVAFIPPGSRPRHRRLRAGLVAADGGARAGRRHVASWGEPCKLHATEGRQKRYIKGAFKQYLSPAVIEELPLRTPSASPSGASGASSRIFFSDVQGFTTISEALSPEDLTALLNEYLTAMTDIIQEEGGTIDKYEGDAIIAFWNAPAVPG